MKHLIACWTLFLISLSIVMAKPQYEQPANSPSSATTSKSPNSVVRVEGDVHAEKAEENNLPGGLNGSSYDSDVGDTTPNAKPNQTKNGRSPAPASSAQTQNAAQGYDGASPSEPATKQSSKADQQRKKAKKGDQMSSRNSATSTPPPSSDSDDPYNKPASPAANAGSKNTRKSENPKREDSSIADSQSTAGSADEKPSEAVVDAEMKTSTSATKNAQQTTEPNVTENPTTNTPSDSDSSPRSLENDEDLTEEQEVSSSTPENQPSETTSVPLPSSSPSDSSALSASVDDNSDSAETAVTEGAQSVATTQESEEVEGVSSSPAPLTTEATTEEDQSNTSPAVESSSPGATTSQDYDQTTLSSSTSSEEKEASKLNESKSTSGETKSTGSSNAASSSTAATPYESAQEADAESPSAKSQPKFKAQKVAPADQSSASDYQGANSSTESTEAGQTTDVALNNNTTEAYSGPANASDSSHSSGYENEEPSSTAANEKAKSLNTSGTSQPVPEQTGYQVSPDSQPPSKEAGNQSSKPNSKPRAWKISQSNTTSPVDADTNDSDNSGDAQAANANSNAGKNDKQVQMSGYGKNEVKPPKASPAVSPQDAVGYDGIVDSLPLTPQHDTIGGKTHIAQSLKRIDAPVKRKWKKYKFDCETETDDRSELLCQEWAQGGLCEVHRPTMFLFCRRTCLCVGPLSEDDYKDSRKQRRFFRHGRL